MEAGPEEAKPQLTSSALQAAIRNFAESHSLSTNEVTEAQVAASPEGIYFWATKHDDTSARGPGAQALGRALKYQPELKAGYALMLDSMKLEFRKAWMATRSFDFTKVTRSTVNSYRKRRDEVGTFKTRLQIQQALGGTDQPEAVEQAENYIRMCVREDLNTGFASSGLASTGLASSGLASTGLASTGLVSSGLACTGLACTGS